MNDGMGMMEERIGRLGMKEREERGGRGNERERKRKEEERMRR